MWTWVLRAGGILLAAYGIFALVGGVLAWLVPVRTAPEMQRKPAGPYRGGRQGPDRALLVESPHQAFTRRIELIDKARRSLDISLHVVKKGKTSLLFFEAVLRAADRGVKVRILNDGITHGFWEFPGLLHTLTAHPNVELRLYNPPKPYAPWRWNALLHDKIVLVDEDLLLLGGRNVGDEYFAPPGYKASVTHDREVAVWRAGGTGPSVLDEAARYFETLWNEKHNKAIPAKPGRASIRPEMAALYNSWLREHPAYFTPGALIEQSALPTRRITLVHNPVHTFKKQPWCALALRCIALDAKRLLLQTPYMTDNPHTLRTMAELQEGGIRLDVLTNSMASSPNLPAFSVYAAARRRFLRRGARLWEYQSSHSIHGKSMLADDDISVVGSFNLDDRSMYIDTETMLVIHSQSFQAVLRGEMETLKGMSLPITHSNQTGTGAVPIQPVPRAKRVVMALAAPLFRLLRFLV